MSTLKNFPKTLKFLKRFDLRTKTNKDNHSTNELIHPRFEMIKNDPLAQKKILNSLLFLMYSEENEALFV